MYFRRTAGVLEHDKANRLSGRQADDNMSPAHLWSHFVDSIAEREGVAENETRLCRRWSCSRRAAWLRSGGRTSYCGSWAAASA